MKKLYTHIPTISIFLMVSVVAFFALRQENIPSIRSEKEYIVNMITHHVDMVSAAKYIAESTAKPEIKQIADSIVVGYTSELENMHRWLQNLHGTTYQDERISYKTDIDREQIDDKIWLRDTIRQQNISIVSSQEVLKKSPHGEIVDFANHIISTRKQSIKEMTDLLNLIE